MVVPVPAQISKLRPRLPDGARRRSLLTTHHPLPTTRYPLSCCSGLSDLCVAPFPVFERSTPLLPITSLQPQQFHAITHSFAQRRAAIPPIFNGFRTLSIATGVYTPPNVPFRTSPPLCSVPRWQIPCSQKLAASLSSLCALFRAPFLCFQELAASFAKTPGVGDTLAALDVGGEALISQREEKAAGDSPAYAWRKT